ncbi:MAG: peptidase T [Rhodothermales bacterium]
MKTVPLTDDRIDALSPVVRRFLRYVCVNTQSDPDSDAVPSTERQKDLGRMLERELSDTGLTNVAMDRNGYVYATLPGRGPAAATRLGLLAHVDTSADAPGDVTPYVHFSYDGRAFSLPGDAEVRVDPDRNPALRDHVGDDLITSDGTSLLGSDDKAGVAVLMQLAEDLASDPSSARPELRFCFTVDEETGRGVDHLDLERFGADIAYTIDGGGTDAIYVETFNAAEAVLSVHGITVHPGYAKGIMVNAARILAHVLAQLPDDEAPEATSGRQGYIHLHRIDASDAAHARARMILRDFTREGLLRKKEFLEAVVESTRNAHPNASFSLDIQDQYRNMRSYIEGNDPRVIRFAHRAADVLDLDLEERLIRGGTDGARLSEIGVPTPNLFNGGHDFHSRFEWNSVQGIEHALEYVKTLVKYWGEHGAEHGGEPA